MDQESVTNENDHRSGSISVRSYGRSFRFFLRFGLQSVLGLEFFNTSAALSELLLAGKERMASGADICSDLSLCGLGHERIAACASNFTFLVLRMDSLFHAIHLFLRSGAYCRCASK